MTDLIAKISEVKINSREIYTKEDTKCNTTLLTEKKMEDGNISFPIKLEA